MRTDVLQAVALAAHGLAYLESRDRAVELLSSNPTFETVHSVEFRRESGLHGGLIADSVGPWFRRLAAEGVVTIRPLLAPCSLLPADSGDWGVLTDGDRGMELWKGTWRARIAGYDDPKPYRVIYTAQRLSRFHLPAPIDPREALTTLAIALQATLDYFETRGDPQWSFGLRRCLELQLEGAGVGEDGQPLGIAFSGREGAVVGAALRAAQAVAGMPAGEPPVADLWNAAMRCLEASVPEVGRAAA